MSIAPYQYIKNDLTARLRSGHELPSRLTLQSLAEHYEVSITPVRTAVGELIGEGLLGKGPNKRLAITAPPVVGKRSKRKLVRPKPPRNLHEVIADDLVKLSLKGAPVYLREEATAEKYGSSRSAIRNILHRLTGEGMLEHIPRHGWRLRPFRQADLQAFVEVREVMELKALKLARPRLVVDDLQRMHDANVLPSESDDLPRVDEGLHEYFISMADNAYITDFFERHGRYYRLLFEWEDHDRAAAVGTVRQHREILGSLMKKKWSTARKALSSHILNNHPILDPDHFP